jgi:hypothetical protein
LEVKLLNFYRDITQPGVLVYDKARVVGLSPTFAGLEAVTSELM